MSYYPSSIEKTHSENHSSYLYGFQQVEQQSDAVVRILRTGRAAAAAAVRGPSAVLPVRRGLRGEKLPEEAGEGRLQIGLQLHEDLADAAELPERHLCERGWSMRIRSGNSFIWYTATVLYRFITSELHLSHFLH